MRLHAMEGKLWNARIDMLNKAVGQSLLKVFGCVWVGIEVDGFGIGQGTQVIDSAHMVVVFMGDEAGVNGTFESNSKHLLSEVGAAVDEDAG